MPSLRSRRRSLRTPSSRHAPTSFLKRTTTRSKTNRRPSTPCSPPAARALRRPPPMQDPRQIPAAPAVATLDLRRPQHQQTISCISRRVLPHRLQVQPWARSWARSPSRGLHLSSASCGLDTESSTMDRHGASMEHAIPCPGDWSPWATSWLLTTPSILCCSSSCRASTTTDGSVELSGPSRRAQHSQLYNALSPTGGMVHGHWCFVAHVFKSRYFFLRHSSLILLLSSSATAPCCPSPIVHLLPSLPATTP
jgi:hypothetical protein